MLTKMLKLLDRNETPAEWWSCGLHGAKVLTMDAEANDPARVLIHDHQNPVGPQHGRFAPEQIHAPEAVSHVAQERQPGGTAGVLSRRVVMGENPANHVFVNWDVELGGPSD